jgi:dolichol-phosphate mannosyltransferase
MRRLTVIAPVFQEEDLIAEFHAQLLEELDRLHPRYETNVLYVCDPGKDHTEAQLQSIADSTPRAQVLFLSRRFGHQAALAAGIDHTHADVVVMMDCDLQHPPSVIPRLIEEFERGAEIVHTIRRYPTGTGFFKRSSSRLFYWLIQALSDTPIVENAADFRLFSGRVCAVFQTQLRERNQFLRGLFSWVGFRQAYVKFDAPHRARGTTKYSLSRMIHFAVFGITSFSKKPLRYSIYLGLLSAMLGLSLAAVTVFQFFAGVRFPAGWATLLALISLLGGAQLVCLGVLGEYIASIFDEAKARPNYLVESARNFAAITPSPGRAINPEIDSIHRPKAHQYSPPPISGT